MPQDVWWGFTTSLVVFVLAPLAVTFFMYFFLFLNAPLGWTMGCVVQPHFMLAYPFLELFKGSAVLAYGLTAVQLVPQAALFGWLARRRTLGQQLWLALAMVIALATVVSIFVYKFGIQSLIVPPCY